MIALRIAAATVLAVLALAGPSLGLFDHLVATILGLGAVVLFGSLLLSLRARPGSEEGDGRRRPSRPVPLPRWSPAPGVLPDVVLKPGDGEPTLEPEARKAPLDRPLPDPEDPTVDVFPAPPEGGDRGEV